MSSQVGGNLSNIETGPSSTTYKGVLCGHTMEGVSFSITPDLRERKVDEYGTYVVDMILQGDKVEVSTKFMEKTLTVLQTVYQMSYGALSSILIGIGRLPGKKSSDRAGLLTLHPLDGNGTEDDVTLWKAAVTPGGEVNFGTVTQDRVFECKFMPLVDESREDGSILGQIGLG